MCRLIRCPPCREGEPAIEAVGLEHLEHSRVLAQSVAQSGIHLEDVAARSHAAVSNQVGHIGHREQVFAGGHRAVIAGRHRAVQLEIQWVAGLFVPAQAVRAQRRRPLRRGGPVEPAVGVDRDPSRVADNVDDRLDAGQVIAQTSAADFHLDRVITQVAVAAHLITQAADAAFRVVVAAGRIHRNCRGRLPSEAPRDRRTGRLVGQLGVQVPTRQFQGGGGRCPIAVAAGLFVGERARRHGGRVDASRVVP